MLVFIKKSYLTRSALIVWLVSSNPAFAEEFVIDTDVTEINGGHTVDGDDTIRVNDGVTVKITGIHDRNSFGLYAYGDNNTLSNSGTVDIEGANNIGQEREYGLFADGNNNTIINSGTVETRGRLDYGLAVEGSGNTISNSGSGKVITHYVSAHALHATNGNNNTIINSGTVETRGNSSHGLLTNGNNNTIINSGTVTASGGGHGFQVNGNNNTVSNSGTVEIIGTVETIDARHASYGILVADASNTITNSGTVTTDGFVSPSIRVTGSNHTIINSGTVTTSGVSSEGILSGYGNENTITNSGTVTTSGDRAGGIFSGFGNESTITNSGTVTTSGDGDRASGIYSGFGNENTITNRGTVTTSGDSASGLLAGFGYGDNNTITNSGTVTTSGDNAHGLFAGGGDNNTISNSGTVLAQSAQSIRMEGADATLNLTAGSVLYGDVHFSDTGSATLNFGAGLNAVVHTDASVPASITSAGFYAVRDDVIFNLDPTGITSMNAARTQVQMATGGLILDAIDARIEPKVTTDTPDDKPGWMHVNGAYLSQSADDGREGFSGFVTSVSVGWEYSEGSGYFAGFNWSDSEVDDGTELNIGGLHAGLYGAWESLEADYVLAVGLFNRGDTERPQANNAVVGGLETATAHQDIVLLTSALSWQGLLGQDHRLRLSYTGAYSESGEFRYQDNRLSIDRQDSHQLEVRSNWTHQLSDMSRLNYGLDLGKQESGDVDVSLFKGASELSIQGESSFYTRGFVGIQSGNGRLELSMDNNEHFEIIVNYNKRF